MSNSTAARLRAHADASPPALSCTQGQARVAPGLLLYWRSNRVRSSAVGWEIGAGGWGTAAVESSPALPRNNWVFLV